MSQEPAADADHFLALLRPIQRELEIYCRRLVWESQEAPDTLQNAVMRAFAAFDRYDPQASFRAWMFKILTREALVMNRKHSRIARHEFQLEPEELSELASAAEPGPAEGQPGPSRDTLLGFHLPRRPGPWRTPKSGGQKPDGAKARDASSCSTGPSPAWDDALEPLLAAGLRILTDPERAVLLLRSIGELRYREIGQTLGIPLGSVMGHLWRARQKMRAFLGRSAPQTSFLKENGL